MSTYIAYSFSCRFLSEYFLETLYVSDIFFCVELAARLSVLFAVLVLVWSSPLPEITGHSYRSSSSLAPDMQLLVLALHLGSHLTHAKPNRASTQQIELRTLCSFFLPSHVHMTVLKYWVRIFNSIRVYLNISAEITKLLRNPLFLLKTLLRFASPHFSSESVLISNAFSVR
jgi:hypothetical protein